MLDITKMKYGKVQLYKRKVHLKDLIQDVIAEMQQAATTHVIHAKGGTKEQVIGDKEKIRQVLINLMSNAIKYSPDADAIDVSISQQKSGVKVCIKDHGIGIDKKDLEHIFKPFIRVANPQKLRMPGMGLGLYIAAEIIKAHGGKLWVTSDREKKQTSFCFLLPTG
jgi:signal transduction histidine kinase